MCTECGGRYIFGTRLQHSQTPGNSRSASADTRLTDNSGRFAFGAHFSDFRVACFSRRRLRVRAFTVGLLICSAHSARAAVHGPLDIGRHPAADRCFKRRRFWCWWLGAESDGRRGTAASEWRAGAFRSPSTLIAGATRRRAAHGGDAATVGGRYGATNSLVGPSVADRSSRIAAGYSRHPSHAATNAAADAAATGAVANADASHRSDCSDPVLEQSELSDQILSCRFDELDESGADLDTEFRASLAAVVAVKSAAATADTIAAAGHRSDAVVEHPAARIRWSAGDWRVARVRAAAFTCTFEYDAFSVNQCGGRRRCFAIRDAAVTTDPSLRAAAAAAGRPREPAATPTAATATGSSADAHVTAGDIPETDFEFSATDFVAASAALITRLLCSTTTW